MSSLDPLNYIQLEQMFKCYSICTLILWAKYLTCQLIGANFQNHPQEDTEKFPESMQKVPEDIKRRERTFLNDVENIPLDLLVFWAAFLVQVFAFISGSTGSESLALIILFSLYCFCRVTFTICYYRAWQPYRSIVFWIGKLSAACAACVLIASSFRINGNSLYLLSRK